MHAYAEPRQKDRVAKPAGSFFLSSERTASVPQLASAGASIPISQLQARLNSNSRVAQFKRFQQMANGGPHAQRLAQLHTRMNRRDNGSSSAHPIQHGCGEEMAAGRPIAQMEFTTGMASADVITGISQDYFSKKDTISRSGSWAKAAFQGLMASISAQLPVLPPVTLMSDVDLRETKESYGNASPDAAFDSETWQLYIDPKYLDQPFSNQRWLTLAEFMTHELRHADQYFRAAMAAASTGHNANEIAEELEIPLPIAQSAVQAQNAPLTALGGQALQDARDIRAQIPGLEAATEESQNAEMYQGLIDLALDFAGQLRTELQALPSAYTYDVNMLGEVAQWRDVLKQAIRDNKAKIMRYMKLAQTYAPTSRLGQAVQAGIEQARRMELRDKRTVRNIDALQSGKITPIKWRSLVQVRYEEHVRDVETYGKKMNAAIAAYRDDPLERDARVAGTRMKQGLEQLEQAAGRAAMQSLMSAYMEGSGSDSY
ncbi:MAG TPA: hypothetical protein VF532_17630 [Candidatus Angelobacter sp.]